MALSTKKELEQQEQWAGAAVGASPLAPLYYVDSANGNDGNDGLSKVHALKTVAQALSLISTDGKAATVVCEPGGSESLSSSLAVSVAGTRIACTAANPQQGYELTGAGTLDLLTVSGADVTLEGLRFTRTAGAGSAKAGILTTAAADRLAVKRCSFDYTALTSAWTNFGIEVTDDCADVTVEDCTFLDCHRGVLFTVATAKDCLRPHLRRNTLFVGQATAFGVHAVPAGTGTVRGLIIDSCLFVEADGDGSSATDAWDGTDNTDAASGPLRLAATVDQSLVADCRAYTALSQAFDTLNNVTAGATIDFVGNQTSAAGDQTDAAGTYFTTTGTVISSSMPNNTQTAGAITGAASAALVLHDILINTDGTGLAGPTNVEFSVDNAAGATGAGSPILLEAVAALGANVSESKKDATSHKLPLLLESGKKIYIHGDDAGGSGAGIATVTMLWQRTTSGGTIAAANI